MAALNDNYDEQDSVCIECIEDHGLREHVKSEGRKDKCVLCGKGRNSVTIRELAVLIDPVIRDNFAPGDMIDRFGPKDESPYQEQEGEDLSYVLQTVTGQYFAFEDVLIACLEKLEPYDPRDGEAPFYDRTTNYEETETYLGNLYEEWDSISDQLKTSRRFFSDSARMLFDSLFQELEMLHYYAKSEELDFSHTGIEKAPRRLGVIQEWPVGTPIFRGRRADTRTDYTTIILNPERELAPPSSAKARAGRMNPEGITVLYGALDEDTCLAEMRSSIGSHIVIGRFETTKPLQLVDFRRLERAYWGDKNLSYFQPDFKVQVEKREFLRRLHRLISQPIIPGHESDYLITQVLAEYLAHVREPNFDGMLFMSTQRKSGTNVVLFPKIYATEEEMLKRFGMRYSDDNVSLYRTKGIEYDMAEVKYVVVDNKVRTYSVYDDDDD